MALLRLQLTRGDYARASAFVVGHLRRLGLAPTSLIPWSIIATVFYLAPLFVIEVVPNHLEDQARTIFRAALAALMVVPILFAFGVIRLRKADARALQPLESSSAEDVVLEATAAFIRIQTESMSAQFPWSAASVFVVDENFAVLLAPRVSPLPITRQGSPSDEQFYDFLRLAQQYKAASAA